jgi:phosphohistidine phosphatase
MARMRLYVVRHAEAEDEGPAGDDESRRLTSDGREEFKRGAEGLGRLDPRIERIFTSPLVRARQTAALLAEALGAPAPEELRALGPGAGPAAVLRALRETGERVAVVGHEPGLGFLVSAALFGSPTGATPLKKGGIACLAFEGDPRPGAATLRWFLTPRQLRLLL